MPAGVILFHFTTTEGLLRPSSLSESAMKAKHKHITMLQKALHYSSLEDTMPEKRGRKRQDSKFSTLALIICNSRQQRKLKTRIVLNIQEITSMPVCLSECINNLLYRGSLMLVLASCRDKEETDATSVLNV